MKLSDVKGDRCIEVVADLIEPIARIAEDDRAMELFAPQKLPEGTTPAKFMASRLRRGLPALLKGHKDDFIEILATIEGVTPEEYAANLDLSKLLSDATELLTDRESISFFFSAGATDGGSSEASASTGDQPE